MLSCVHDADLTNLMCCSPQPRPLEGMDVLREQQTLILIILHRYMGCLVKITSR